MAACRYRVSKLRSEIESERQRQGRLQTSIRRKIDTMEACKQSTASTSVIKVVVSTPSPSSNHNVRVLSKVPSPDWSTQYELNRGDWSSPVKVHVCRYQKTPPPTTSLRHVVAAKRIGRWVTLRVAARKAASVPLPRSPAYSPLRINPDDLLARIALQIHDRATLKRQNKAAYILQRFFTLVLDRRSTTLGQHRSHRILLRQEARRRQMLEQAAMDNAVRLIQAAYRGSSARRRFTWKQSHVKGHFMHVLILEAEWTTRPGTAISVLQQLAAAYWSYFETDVYEPPQRALLLRLHLLCATKAITYGYTPSSDNGGAAEWWLNMGRRFLLLWQRNMDEPALLQEALAAFDHALRMVSEADVDPEVLCDIVHVYFALGLYCHLLKRCQHVALELWGHNNHLDRKRRLWLWEGQAYFHLGEYKDAAVRFKAVLNHPSATTACMPYNVLDLWLILGRCAALDYDTASSQLYYTTILRHLYATDDILRRGLTWEDAANDATLHLSAGSKFALHRDFPLAKDLLSYGKHLNAAYTTPDHDRLWTECYRHTSSLDTRASRAVWEAQKRIPLTRLRERLGVVL
ncbi:hypothetical protein AaE_008104 [Aphanomyces astaci]|uniref:Uncharacterized protein n=1 Tax=Aphanomyces astaci TaxID=112090 RepID=A0A6A5AEB9_APHAT|nr:hypothetical protein AaE_008104 [Aphanomyces astaci]